MGRLRNFATSFGPRPSVQNVVEFPVGSRLVFREVSVDAMDQERLMISLEDPHRFSRVWGVVTSLRGESNSDNTKTPASGQVLSCLDWLDKGDD